MKQFHSITLFLCLTTFVNCSLFSSTDLYISSNPTVIYSNGTSTDYFSNVIKQKDYKSGIVPFDNLTQPSASGLEGILYDRGDSCQLDTPFNITRPLISSQRKIALVRSGGGCNFYQKVYNSELDGAAGVIIYDIKPFRDDDSSGSMKISKGNLTITMYYVDLIIGQELFAMLQYAASQPINTTYDNTTSYQPVVNLVMYPAIGGFPSAWEFTLIIVVALLAISFLASVGMHWHLWRIRRRQRALFENGLLDINTANMTQQNTRKTIDPSSLSVFPTRIIGDELNTLHLSRVESNRSQRSNKALENVELLQQQPNIEEEAEQAPAEACVICLDEFTLGEQVRKLPCGHEYHCECIDPWLTIKSVSCPLCKHDCSTDIPKTETEQHQQESTMPPPPPSYTPFSLFSRSSNNSSPSSFGPTIAADRAEEFSRSWMARSLPRNMRRQIHEAAQAAAAANRESVIELPARMTQPDTIDIIPPQEQQQASSSSSRQRLVTLPKFFKPSSTSSHY